MPQAFPKACVHIFAIAIIAAFCAGFFIGRRSSVAQPGKTVVVCGEVTKEQVKPELVNIAKAFIQVGKTTFMQARELGSSASSQLHTAKKMLQRRCDSATRLRNEYISIFRQPCDYKAVGGISLR